MPGELTVEVSAPRRYWRRGFLTAAAVVGLGAVMLAVISGGGPANGKVSQGSSAELVERATQETYQTYAGRHLSFEYPNSYKLATPAANAGYLEVANLIASSSSSKRLALAVRPGNVAQDAGFRSRQSDSSFEAETFEAAGEEGYLFTGRTDGFEQTLFVQKGNNIVTLALTDPGGQDLSLELKRIIDSLSWQ